MRHRQARRPIAGHDAECLDVVEGEHSGQVRGDELAGEGDAALVVGRDRAEPDDVGQSVDRPIASPARPVRLRSAYHPDRPVPGGVEMGDAEFDDRFLIECHRCDALRPAVHEDHRGVVDDLPPPLGCGDRAAHDERIDAVGQRPRLRQLVGRTLVGVGEEHCLPIGAAASLYFADHLREERVRDVGNQHADRADPPAGQVPSGAIRGVAELVDRGVDDGPRGLTDELRAAEDARHRARMHAGFDSNIGEGDRTSRHRVLPSPPRVDSGRDGVRQRTICHALRASACTKFERKPEGASP